MVLDPVHADVNVRMTGTGSSRAAVPTFSTGCDYPDGGPIEDTACHFLNFPDTGVGGAVTLPLHITNLGCPPLKLTDVQIYPSDPAIGTDAGFAFRLHDAKPTDANPLIIQAGKHADLLVDFAPFTANETVAASLLVVTNGSGDNSSSQPRPDGTPVHSNTTSAPTPAVASFTAAAASAGSTAVFAPTSTLT